MAILTKKLNLTNVEISHFIDDIQPLMQKMHIERKNALRLSLSLEEILLRWQEHFGVDVPVTVYIKNRFGTLYISISLKGDQFNPINEEQKDFNINVQLLSKLGLAPSYTYKKNANYISLKLSKQKDNSIIMLVASIALAVILGLLGINFLPSFSSNLLDQVLIPIRTTILNLLTAVAVPVVFFSIFQGIVGIDDINNFGKIGKKMILRFIGKVALFTALAALIMIPVFSLDPLGDSNISGVGGTLQLILDIFPKTIVAPFSDGNALQVIVLAVVIGLAVLILDSRADGVKNLGIQLGSVFHVIMEWIGKLIPILVFLLILETILSGNSATLINLWKPIIVVSGLCILMMIIEIIYISIKFKVSPLSIIKKLLPSNLIAFGTSCAMATYSVTSDTCEKDLGVDKKITNFGLPIGIVVYKPGVAIYYLMILFYGVQQYQLGCSIDWIVIAWITSTLLSIATPPVSGGTMACFAILLHQMSIPSEAIAFALAINVIVDRFCATADLTMLEVELALVANKHQLLDKNLLKKIKK